MPWASMKITLLIFHRIDPLCPELLIFFIFFCIRSKLQKSVLIFNLFSQLYYFRFKIQIIVIQNTGPNNDNETFRKSSRQMWTFPCNKEARGGLPAAWQERCRGLPSSDPVPLYIHRIDLQHTPAAAFRIFFFLNLFFVFLLYYLNSITV